jgi:hypothetical protein
MNETSKPYIVGGGKAVGFHETHAGPSCFMVEHMSAGRDA